jgi:mannose-6-phosphate isomerase-like protein (cupin superfamily)
MSGWERHENYDAVRRAAAKSHANGRRFDEITDDVTLLARLYAYGLRGHIIGAFHATALALEQTASTVHPVNPGRRQAAVRALQDLAALSLEAVPTDFRAVLTTFHQYDQTLVQAIGLLRSLGETEVDGEFAAIEGRFLKAVNAITGSSGIAITRDDEIPEQASFIVPSLGITIAPLVYGDQHSWNMAFLSGSHLDVPRHRHHEGAEIHLGMGALLGDTCLGPNRAEVTEGYAMPIPAGTPHGFINRAGHDHRLPFIFGSKRLGGWGVFPDVEPQPIPTEELTAVSREAKELNGTVYLDREIKAIALETGTKRRSLVSPERTFRPQSGGLALSIARVEREPLVYQSDRFRAVGVVRGCGRVTIGSAEAELEPHAHFGIPTGARATITARDGEPLVLLDAELVETLS